MNDFDFAKYANFEQLFKLWRFQTSNTTAKLNRKKLFIPVT